MQIVTVNEYGYSYEYEGEVGSLKSTFVVVLEYFVSLDIDMGMNGRCCSLKNTFCGTYAKECIANANVNTSATTSLN